MKGSRAMKRLFFLGIGSAFIFAVGSAGPAQADNGPHISTAASTATAIDTAVGTDGCAACHRVHTAKSADGMLLKTTTQKELCYTCHGTTGSGAVTDVQGGVGFDGTDKALRGGGFEKALIDTAGGTAQYAVTSRGLRPTAQKIPVLTAGEATTSSHSIDGSPQTIWGNGAISATVNLGKAGVALECGSCHDPHGNKNYRILRPVPNDSGVVAAVITAAVPAVYDNSVPPVLVTPAIPAVMGSAGVAIPDQVAKKYTTADYWQTLAPGVPAVSGKTGLPVVSPDGFIANISDWCLTCHTRYEGKASAGAIKAARETNSGDAVFTYRHTTSKIDVNGTRNCITCHVAHGSNATMAGASSKVEMPGGLPPVTGNAGDSRLLRVNGRGVCIMCHNM